MDRGRLARGRVGAVVVGAALAATACESPRPPPLAPDAGVDAGAGADAAVDRFDTSVIALDEEPGASPCRLSADRSDLLLRLRNDGAEASPGLAVEITTVGTPHALRVAAMAMAPGAGTELAFDRGPVA